MPALEGVDGVREGRAVRERGRVTEDVFERGGCEKG